MKTMIAIPCMDMVHTMFMTSLLSLRKSEGTEVAVASSSLVYESRNVLAKRAIKERFDRVLWLDSDMRFDPDLMEVLAADMDQFGMEFVSGLYFTRKNPVKPCAYKICHDMPDKEEIMVPTSVSIDTVPEGLLEVEATGFGCVLMTVDLIRACGPRPFFPMDGYGEDLTFCRSARAAGAKLWLDGRIRPDHVGQSLINMTTWKG